MKEFLIRVVSGFLLLFFLLYIGPMMNIGWLQADSPSRMLVVPIALVGGWGTLLLYKKFVKKPGEGKL
ncbi:hypothetical protein DS745_23055 [Anaerobacillus alkaliphilus]|uniref:Uncharacterized protein n=1 Tax=Anaerobacillus alkaliphilus TaxID=1548597 RepID=A0A4Q0VNE2_9BACI|nr:hypothetical protein [Anaerobacillus alkaliphilus]RXI96584.1 hypothetical protein DS745_23055 [Anaerobacillus alkaliphilus]